ncbi:MAG TPA: PEGA domain-containing protein [Gallionella sp.]|nr:PEGA domain-containing protein [Gallionella sp.]
MSFIRSRKVLALLNLMLVAGCSSTADMFPPAGNNPIEVESIPSGAEVYVMGEKVGLTPLEVSHMDVFPNTYPKEKESMYGRITLKKEGCFDYTRTVSGGVSKSGLQAKLDCAQVNPAMSSDASRGNQTVEQRLDKIKDLLDKGLITEDEAKKARERILNEL